MFLSSSARILLYRNRNHSVISPVGYNYLHTASAGSDVRYSTFYLISSFLRSRLVKNELTSKLRNLGNLQACLRTCITLNWLKSEMCKFRTFLKGHSFHIINTCTQQCECVVAHRVRRGQQIFNLYTRLWDEVALREFGRRLRQQLARRGKEMLISAIGISAFSWEKDKIPDEEMLRYAKELEEISYLFDKKWKCPNCELRPNCDKTLPDKICCQCPASKSATSTKEKVPSEWMTFLEGDDVLIWRKLHDISKGLYAYKVYGKYDDVSANTFLQAQIDMEYRKEWDNTAVTLKVIDSDPESNSDVIYWEMQWPKLFSNRDYVFNRRYMICKEKNVIIIVNRCIEHPCCPERPKNHRVKEYWSYMVIRPFTHFNKPGIEFVLTYFDNPGVSIPAPLSAWVAMTGLPDFLSRLRAAARELGNRRTHLKTEPDPVENSHFTAPEENGERNSFFHKVNAARLFL